MSAVQTFLEQRLDEFLDEIASDKPAPGGGAVAAVVVSMAGALVAMAARFSRDWDGADEVVERADALRRRVAPLAPADAHAFEEVLTAMRLPRHLEPEVRNTAIAHALARAAEIPLEIGKEAAEIAALGALVAEKGNPNLRGDAVAAVFLAQAGARIGANLVEINLGTTERDERLTRAREHVSVTEAAVVRALAAGP